MGIRVVCIHALDCEILRKTRKAGSVGRELFKGDLMEWTGFLNQIFGKEFGDGVVEFDFVLEDGIGEGDTGEDFRKRSNFVESVTTCIGAFVMDFPFRLNLALAVFEAGYNEAFLFEV